MGMTQRLSAMVCLAALAVCSWPARAQFSMFSFEFVKVAETGTPAPGGVGTFTGFGVPNYGGFVGTFDGGSGAYGIEIGWDGRRPTASVRKLADTTTPIPGGLGTFASFNVPTDGVFRATGAGGQEGLYRAGSGATPLLTTVADRNTAAPGGGTFTAFGAGPTGSMFYAQTSTGLRGVYRPTPQGLSTVADTNTTVPGGGRTAKFEDFGGTVGRWTFRGQVGGKFGVYGSWGGPLQAVFDETSLVLNSFSGPYEPLFGSVVGAGRDSGAFVVQLLPGVDVLYEDQSFPTSGSYHYAYPVVATLLDRTPDRSATFERFGGVGRMLTAPEYGGSFLVFQATNADGTEGIYVKPTYGSLVRLLDTRMLLDGKPLTSLSMIQGSVNDYLGFNFRAAFADGSSGIYSAQPVIVPEPGSLAVVVLTVAVFGLWRRPRRVLEGRTGSV